MGLHLVSNGNMTLREFSQIAKQVDPYVDIFQIREKQKTAIELYEGIQLLLDLGISAQKIFVNDRLDVALSLGVAGVQLAYHSLPLKVVKDHFHQLQVGCSIHSWEEALQVESGGASFAMYGHIFSTNSKPGLEPRGCHQLKEVCNRSSIPIIAIGGITPENTRAVLEHGASGVAVISGILGQEDPISAASLYHEIIQKWKEEQREKAL
ncbi:thiazole tautomerase TenI [Bacillus pinisoli]|uniref:thiazole tautomerase TenI n=1 Tax=Bacillus pinisoli TaxID=2901866 RepID=UPI001FF2F529|nr:thiazole tautomerase TenI [Bacillus pinisoli]